MYTPYIMCYYYGINYINISGNVTRYLSMTQVQSSNLSPLVSRSIDTLLTCATAGNNMKTRWNACHALGNILSSGKMPIEKMAWKSRFLTVKFLKGQNFKIIFNVRIQACSAVCGLPRREDYGGEYFTLWRMLLTGLDNAQNIPDYQEIRHRDELINQISLGISQLTMLLKLSDCGPLRELLELHKDMAAPLMKKAQQELTPEKAQHALKAQSHIQDLLLTDALTEAQEQALNILKDLTECT
ncbi:unnamed protein product [Meganyctiphanes norvegica]|uniref:HEAT repeat-containing protein 6 n=1 Tax=Meganyctiphanes norvegica TaxID=48144 RepID=A0AAV2QB71_MEGNR